MDTDEHGLTRRILSAVFEVSNVLGPGFLEKVYERALLKELMARGLGVETQVTYEVQYKGDSVGIYVADLIVEHEVLLELKCVESLGSHDMAQCINYLRASGKHVCLLINFQRAKVEWKRIML